MRTGYRLGKCTRVRLGFLKICLVMVEAASSEVGSGSKLFMLVAASVAHASAALFPGTLLCPGIH